MGGVEDPRLFRGASFVSLSHSSMDTAAAVVVTLVVVVYCDWCCCTVAVSVVTACHMEKWTLWCGIVH